MESNVKHISFRMEPKQLKEVKVYVAQHDYPSIQKLIEDALALRMGAAPGRAAEESPLVRQIREFDQNATAEDRRFLAELMQRLLGRPAVKAKSAGKKR